MYASVIATCVILPTHPHCRAWNLVRSREDSTVATEVVIESTSYVSQCYRNIELGLSERPQSYRSIELGVSEGPLCYRSIELGVLERPQCNRSIKVGCQRGPVL